MNNYDNPGFYVGPMVYYGTYPLPLPLWNQIFGKKADIPENNSEIQMVKNYFAMPFPEDQE